MRRSWTLLLCSCAAPAPQAAATAAEPGPVALVAAAAPAPLPDPGMADMWRWTCCNGRYSGGLALTQSGQQLRGIFLSDEGMGTYVDGSSDGPRLTFTRRWLNAGRLYSQIYSVLRSPDAQRLEGSFVETHAPGPAIEFSAERRFQPELHDFGGAPAAAEPQPEQLGHVDPKGRFIPPGCDCSHPCGCSGVPSLMECHTACGCPACPPGIP
jgi:hypothetical protein